MSDGIIETVLATFCFATACASAFFLGRLYGMREAFRLDDEFNAEIIDSYEKALMKYDDLLENYKRAYKILRDNDLLPGGEPDEAADEGAEGAS